MHQGAEAVESGRADGGRGRSPGPRSASGAGYSRVDDSSVAQLNKPQYVTRGWIDNLRPPPVRRAGGGASDPVRHRCKMDIVCNHRNSIVTKRRVDVVGRLSFGVPGVRQLGEHLQAIVRLEILHLCG